MKWICKTEEETLDLKYKLPGTVFLKKMSVIFDCNNLINVTFQQNAVNFNCSNGFQ